jgi:poly-gamma-glutamate synthesis protein (capsule biosynthesis protein)
MNSFFNQSSMSTTPNVTQSNVTMFFTGDVMLGRGVDGLLASGQNVFRNVDPMFLNADAVVINLEDPMTTSSTNFKKTVPLKANPIYAPLLKKNNIVVACLANNHIMDYGNTGLTDTINTLKSNGINYTGAGYNIDQATQPVYLNIKGRKIAVLNFLDNSSFTEFLPSEMPGATINSSGYAPADWNIIKQRIDESKKNSDITIVVFHYGNEYSTTPNPSQIELSHECIDEGADMVIGDHPHVIQKIESYKGKPIFYSLGNFVFDQSNIATHSSLMLEMDMVGNETKIIVHPMTLVNSIPRPMDNTTSITLLNQLKTESSLNMTIEGGDGVITFPI